MINFYKRKICKYNSKINSLFGGAKIIFVAPKGKINIENNMRFKLELKINFANLERNRAIFLGSQITGANEEGEKEIEITDKEYDLIIGLIEEQDEIMDINKFMNDAISIPKFSYPLDPQKINTFIDKLQTNCENRFVSLIKIILNNTQYVSFYDFIKNFKSSLFMFEFQMQNNKSNYILHIPNPTANINGIKEKSNYWTSQMAYHLLEEKPSWGITFLEDDLIKRFEYLLQINKNTDFINILLCDDGIYSGDQMHKVIQKLNNNSPNNVKLIIHIICPYITNYAMEKLSVFNNIIIYNTNIIKMTKEIISTNDIKYINEQNIFVSLNSSPIYMEHKMPDFMSSIPDLYGSANNSPDRDIICVNGVNAVNKVDYRVKYIIENCSFSDTTKDNVCPYPIYKNKYKNETNPALQKSHNLTPKQFIEIFKNNFDKIKNNNDIRNFINNTLKNQK
jgi:hypothetical protein